MYIKKEIEDVFQQPQQVDEIPIERLLSERRDVRYFSSEPVPTALIQQLLELTRYIPTNKNARQIQYIVIGPKAISKLIPVVVDVLSGELTLPQGIRDEINEGAQLQNLVFRGASCAVVVLVPRQLEAAGMDDGVIAMATLELLAESRSLGTSRCVLLRQATLKDPRVQAVLGIPDELAIAGTLALGTPAIFAPQKTFQEVAVQFV